MSLAFMHVCTCNSRIEGNIICTCMQSRFKLCSIGYFYYSIAIILFSILGYIIASFIYINKAR